MAASLSAVITWDYKVHAGPWCTDHKSVQCEHALDAIKQRTDALYIAEFLDAASPGQKLKLLVPLWPTFYMWEDLEFVIAPMSALGNTGVLTDRGKHATFDLGVERLISGESAWDLGVTMTNQFSDIMELDRPSKLPGCKAPTHGMKYQQQIENLARRAREDELAAQRLMPHLYGLMGRRTPMCAFCWGDSYGGDARRVSSNPVDAAKADDFDDLLPDSSLGGKGR
jgi:hypothetical protein